MIRVFKHYVPASFLLLGLAEVVALLFAVEIAWHWRIAQLGIDSASWFSRWPPAVTYAAVIYIAMLAVGVYQSSCVRSVRAAIPRILVGISAGMAALSVIFFFLPGLALWRSIFVYAALLSLLLVIALRLTFTRLGGWNRLRRRVLVLGAGARAQRLAELAAQPSSSFQVAGFIRMSADEAEVAAAVPRESIPSLAEFAQKSAAEEVILAMKERRGSLPVKDLLEVRLSGTRVLDMSSFLEKETGRVDLDSLNPSWMIFSDGFLAGQGLSAIFKRAFDLLASTTLLLATAPILLVTAVLVKVTSPGPIFYRQVRVGQFGNTFAVMKFRSMRQDAEKDGKPQWAQQGDPRVTRIGRIIRSTRIDEIPQIFNVFVGDMSFVGPRPERPYFVDELSQSIPFYAERHMVKPGITGWAQLNYPYGASIEDARHKLEYDLYYVKNYTIFLDLLILIQTVRVVLWQDGVR